MKIRVVVKARVSRKTSSPNVYLVAAKAVVNWIKSRGKTVLPAFSEAREGDADYSETDESGYWTDDSVQKESPVESLRAAQSGRNYQSMELYAAD
jgi:hypothetical protein